MSQVDDIIKGMLSSNLETFGDSITYDGDQLDAWVKRTSNDQITGFNSVVNDGGISIELRLTDKPSPAIGSIVAINGTDYRVRGIPSKNEFTVELNLNKK